MRYVIFGGGPIGGGLAARLLMADQDVWLVDHNQANMTNIYPTTSSIPALRCEEYESFPDLLHRNCLYLLHLHSRTGRWGPLRYTRCGDFRGRRAPGTPLCTGDDLPLRIFPAHIQETHIRKFPCGIKVHIPCDGFIPERFPRIGQSQFSCFVLCLTENINSAQKLFRCDLVSFIAFFHRLRHGQPGVVLFSIKRDQVLPLPGSGRLISVHTLRKTAPQTVVGIHS